MCAWPSTLATATSLSGSEGELVSVRIRIEPQLLEDLLDALAQAPFPINPEIFHGWPTTVEFPAYRSRLAELRRVLQGNGFSTSSVEVSRMLDAILG
jgi:hypothetical protein